MRDAADCVRRLAELAGVLAPEYRTFDWLAIESDIGFRLPADYKLLAESFPDGWFRRFVRIERPEQSPDGRVRLLSDFASAQLEDMRQWRAEGTGSFPYPIFPEPGGVLPWGDIREGGQAFWLTGPGDPDDWPVVATTQQCEYWDQFDGTVCEFLIEVAAGRYNASGFTEGPIHVVMDESGVHTAAQRVDLASRPVFEPESPVSAEGLVPPVRQGQPPGPRADFWVRQLLELGADRLPVNELAAVRELAGPPSPGVAPVDWATVHARLGFELPPDYRGFIDTYGPGTFGDFRIAAPGAPGEMDLFALLERKYNQVRSLPRGELDAPCYPEPGGTICWGETTSGYTCGWAPTSADPGQWNVVAIAGKALSGFSLRPGMSFSTVLREHKEHAEQHPGLYLGLFPPRDPSAGPVTFTPYASG